MDHRNATGRVPSVDNSAFWLEYYGEKRINGDLRRERRYAQIIRQRIWAHDRVADLGVGVGFLSKELDSLGIRVVGIDLSPMMLKAARSYLGHASNTKLVHADTTLLPMASNIFDGVVAMSLIEHFTVEGIQQSLLPEIRRMLRPGGMLFTHIPIRTLKTRAVRSWRKYVRRDIPCWAIDDSDDATHRAWLGFGEFVSLVNRNGFLLDEFGFQLGHSKSGKGVRLIARTADAILNHAVGGDLFDYPTRITQMIQAFIKSSLATSCYCLFRIT